MWFIGMILNLRQSIEKFVRRDFFLCIAHMKDIAQILGEGCLIESADFKSYGIGLHRFYSRCDVA